MPTLTPTTPTAIEFDAVVAALRDEGIDAYVEQTGGGCATVLVGEPEEFVYKTGDGRVVSDWHYPAAVGPGWFEGEGWTRGHGAATDLAAGPEEEHLFSEHGVYFDEDNVATIEKIVAVIKKTLEVSK